MSLRAAPITQKQAFDFVNRKHRHHKAPRGWKFGIGAFWGSTIKGVVVVGRPKARMLQDGYTLEVTRLCSDGFRNVCSFLLSRVVKVAEAIGYRRVVTYILESETGVSLKASGWLRFEECGGGSWDRDKRPRVDAHPTCVKVRWEAPIGDALARLVCS